MGKSGVYKIYFTNDDKKRSYIGISTNVVRRKSDHINTLRNQCHKNAYLQNAFNKFGEENFCFEILEYCNKESIIKRESYYIKMYNTFDRTKGFNRTTGGEHHIYDEEYKKKISARRKGAEFKKESRIKLTVHNLKKNRPNSNVEVINGIIYVDGEMYVRPKNGKFLTSRERHELLLKQEEIKQMRIRIAYKYLTSRVKSEEEKEKIRKANLGKKASNETKAKIASYHKGKNISQSHRAAIRAKLGKKISLINLSGDIFKFESMKQCRIDKNFSGSEIKKIILGKEVKGYKLIK